MSTASSCGPWGRRLGLGVLGLVFAQARFYGVCANASLFPVPSRERPGILRQLRDTLKRGGVLFSSNPHGRDEEGWSNGRYGAYHDPDTWRAHVTQAGFVELAHYYRPEGLPRERHPWLSSVWRKPA